MAATWTMSAASPYWAAPLPGKLVAPRRPRPPSETDQQPYLLSRQVMSRTPIAPYDYPDFESEAAAYYAVRPPPYQESYPTTYLSPSAYSAGAYSYSPPSPNGYASTNPTYMGPAAYAAYAAPAYAQAYSTEPTEQSPPGYVTGRYSNSRGGGGGFPTPSYLPPRRVIEPPSFYMASSPPAPPTERSADITRHAPPIVGSANRRIRAMKPVEAAADDMVSPFRATPPPQMDQLMATVESTLHDAALPSHVRQTVADLAHMCQSLIAERSRSRRTSKDRSRSADVLPGGSNRGGRSSKFIQDLSESITQRVLKELGAASTPPSDDGSPIALQRSRSGGSERRSPPSKPMVSTLPSTPVRGNNKPSGINANTCEGTTPTKSRGVLREVLHTLRIDTVNGDGNQTNKTSTREVNVVRVHKNPDLIIVPKILTLNECDSILSLYQHGEPDTELSADATNIHGDLSSVLVSLNTSTWLARVCRRLAAVVQKSVDLIRTIRIVTFPPDSGCTWLLRGPDDDRMFYLFLEEPPIKSGGELCGLGLKVKPQRGTGLVFNAGIEMTDRSVRADSNDQPTKTCLIVHFASD